jgi:hypothetical protein
VVAKHLRPVHRVHCSSALDHQQLSYHYWTSGVLFLSFSCPDGGSFGGTCEYSWCDQEALWGKNIVVELVVGGLVSYGLFPRLSIDQPDLID